jgi:ABC-type glycerol-3-phosphate transport system permease component
MNDGHHDHRRPPIGLATAERAPRAAGFKLRSLVPAIYIIFLMLPIYWLLNMSFKTTNEILGSFTLWPTTFTLDNYIKIFTDPTWYSATSTR